jgi:hypothetical protein
MQTLTRPKRPQTMLKPPRTRRKRFSPLMLIGAGVTVLLVVGAVAYTVLGKEFFSHAAAPNANCTLIVPNNPLTAQGLATPYQLVGTNAAQDGPCNEANANQSAFVQATIYDPANSTFSVYSPLVIDQGTQPAVAPVVPNIPAGAVVGIWFGFNGTTLTLQDNNGSLAQGNCVNGLPGDPFGQFAYCNAPQFFGTVNQAIGAGNLAVPPLGIANDGLTCPSTRDFSVIDQDQSDNVQTQYLANANGQTAQFSAANQAQLAGATTLANPSDNGLISVLLDPALGCTPWMAPDLANNGALAPSMALDELQAAADQPGPVALVPANDPMVLSNGNESLQKTNLYRQGVDQPVALNIPADANPTSYCENEFTNPDATTGLIRLTNDALNFFQNVASPVPAAANNMANFLLMRANQSFTNLGCQNFLNIADPVNLTMDGNGVVVGATVTLPNGTTAQVGQQAAPPAATPTPAPTNGNGGAGAATPTPTPTNGNGGAGAATPTPAPNNNGNTSSNGNSTSSNDSSNGSSSNGSSSNGGSTTDTGSANGGGVYTTVPGTTDTGSTAQGGNTTGTQQTSTTYTATPMQSTSLEIVQLCAGVFVP